MHYASYTQDTWVPRRALLPQRPRKTDISTNFHTIERRQSNDRKKPDKLLRRVQHRPSAQGQEGLPHKGEGRADQGASSLGKGQHVALEKRRSH